MPLQTQRERLTDAEKCLERDFAVEEIGCGFGTAVRAVCVCEFRASMFTSVALLRYVHRWRKRLADGREVIVTIQIETGSCALYHHVFKERFSPK